jgi:hypothetical protein
VPADANDDEDIPELTQRERRLRRIAAYESSSYGQRARIVQRETNDRLAGRTPAPPEPPTLPTSRRRGR